MQRYDSDCFPNIIPNSYLHTLKTRFHPAVLLVMHIMKFPLKSANEKAWRAQLATSLFASCNVLIYYHIIQPALFIYLIMHKPRVLNCKTDPESDDGTARKGSAII